ncbi:bombesin receptor-activated protein C6orf89 homolog [Saccoglossus kowalevskii]|uniref:Bombesin receptor-activated protein C6orf89 homolog n=1 Tax=Saccoglossus kowalevskii TaxID=10224 RepID=A0ABM0H161_SACKO|nr:PREDICTED: bombesin receptor-activated protein C6orf89 homolog [Saccoglossus kowalevskii]
MAAAEKGLLYDKLSENVEKIQNLGKSWGMDNDEIESCIYTALEFDCPSKQTTVTSKIMFGLRVFVLIFSFLLAMYVFMSFHKPTQQMVSKQTQSWQYPILRFVRLLTLPLAKKYHLDVFHELECIVDNPFYTEEALDCWPCEIVEEIQDFSGFDNFTEYYYHNGIPFYVTDADGVVVTYEMLRDLYIENREDMETSIDSFISTDSSITDVYKLFSQTPNSQDIVDSNLGVMWRTQRVSGVRLIRSLFPRPYFIPEKAEVCLEKYVFIDSPKAEPFQIPSLQSPNGWLAQGSGQRQIVLIPSEGCQSNCSDVSIVLEPMDILFYHTHYWKPQSFPYGDQVSVMFAASFL